MQLHNPLLGIRYLNIPYLPVAEIFFLNQIQHEIITNFGIVAYTLLQTDIALQEGNNGNFSGSIVNSFIKLLLDCLFFFPQFFQIRGINGLPFSVDIRIAVLINQVFSLALPCL
jgi:hypothetical protein